MVEAVPYTDDLDAYLNTLVQTLKDAVDQAIKKAEDDPQAVDKTLDDCEEILDHVMEGNVQEWLN